MIDELAAKGKDVWSIFGGRGGGDVASHGFAGSREPSIPSSPVRWSTPLRGVALGFCPSTKWTACNIKRCKTSQGWNAPRKAHWQLTHQLPGEINSFRTRFSCRTLFFSFLFGHNDLLIFIYLFHFITLFFCPCPLKKACHCFFNNSKSSENN